MAFDHYENKIKRVVLLHTPYAVIKFTERYARMKQGKKPNKRQTMTAEALKAHAALVMKSLGKGHSERVYHRALITLFNKKKIFHRSEVASPVYFMGEVVGIGRCDLVIGDMVVEIKANSSHPSSSHHQLRKYTEGLGAAESRLLSGVIINFNQTSGVVQMVQVKAGKTQTKKGGKSR